MLPAIVSKKDKKDTEADTTSAGGSAAGSAGTSGVGSAVNIQAGGSASSTSPQPVLKPLQSYTHFLPNWGSFKSLKDHENEWQPVKKLGNANFGKVFLYRHKPTGHVVSIKRMSTDERNSDGHIKRTGVLERYNYKHEGENPVIEIGASTYISYGETIEKKFQLIAQCYADRKKGKKDKKGGGSGSDSDGSGTLTPGGSDKNAKNKKHMRWIPLVGSRFFDDGISEICGASTRGGTYTALDEVNGKLGGLFNLAALGGDFDLHMSADHSIKSLPSIPSMSLSKLDLDADRKNLNSEDDEPGNATMKRDSVMGGSGPLDLSRSSFNGVGGKLDPSLDKKAAVVDRLPQHVVSPNILQMRGCVMDNEFVYFITEPCLGGELFSVVAERKRLSEKTVRIYMRQTIDATLWMHIRGLGHRDISLENILLTDEIPEKCIRLMDFGMACNLYKRKPPGRARGEHPSAEDPSIPPGEYRDRSIDPMAPAPDSTYEDAYYSSSVGKDLYRAPELYMAPLQKYRVGPADVFCLGVCFFMMLCGKPLWRKCTHSDRVYAFLAQGGPSQFELNWKKLVEGWGLNSILSDDASDLIGKMLQFEPELRWTCLQVLEHRFFKQKK